MKSNLFLSCFAIILLLSAYLERRTLSPPTGAPAEDTISAPLFSLSPEAVTMLSLRNLDQCVVARKEADSVEFLREVSEMLLQGRVVRRFSPPVKDFSEYGLASATWQIAQFTSRYVFTRLPSSALESNGSGYARNAVVSFGSGLRKMPTWA